MKHYHFAIVGGGLTGATAALALSRLGLSTCIIETNVAAQASTSALLNTPTIALSYASRRFFETLGLWQKIVPYTEAIRAVRVSTQGHWGSSVLSQPKAQYDALGYVVSVLDLKNILLSEIIAHKNITLLDGIPLTDVEFKQDRWICTRKDQSPFSSHLLVSAEGVQSVIAQKFRLGQTHTYYPHHAMMANIQLSQSLEGVAIERFIQSGVLALLPWKENHATMILSLAEDKLSQYQAMTDELILNYCQHVLGETHGLIQAIGKKIFTPLTMALAHQHYYKQLILLGNSAHTLHPIAAQGFNLGVRDIQRLYKQISNSHDVSIWGRSINDLNTYMVDCLGDQQTIIAGTDRLARSVSQIPNSFKALGITGLECMTPFKNYFTRLAMGLDF